MKLFIHLLLILVLTGCISTGKSNNKVMPEENYEPSALTPVEAVRLVPFEVKIPTYFPFEVEYSHAQLYPPNPKEVVFSFWQRDPDQAVNLHISEEELVINEGQTVKLSNGQKASYSEEMSDVGFIQKISWHDEDGLFYQLDYRAGDKIEIEELLKIQSSLEIPTLPIH